MKKSLIQIFILAVVSLSFSANAALITKKWKISDATNKHGLWTHNLKFNGDNYFNFDDDLFLTEYSDGTAHLYGHASDSDVTWLIDIVWDGLNSESDGSVKTGGGQKLDNWYYYHNLVSGTISTDFDGGFVANLERIGPAFQIGLGANDKTGDFGGSAWLNVNDTGKPGHWDLNMDFIFMGNEQNLVDVPTPPVLSLFLVALLGLGLSRKKA